MQLDRSIDRYLFIKTLPPPLPQSISLSYVNILLGEWIPMGANNIVALNDRLGSFDRCQASAPTLIPFIILRSPVVMHLHLRSLPGSLQSKFVHPSSPYNPSPTQTRRHKRRHARTLLHAHTHLL
jgi:hypothetical protein